MSDTKAANNRKSCIVRLNEYDGYDNETVHYEKVILLYV
jgi:hypothetical protein